MRNLFKLFTLILLFSCNKNEEPQEQVKNDREKIAHQVYWLKSMKKFITKSQDTLVSAFFLDLIMHYQV